MKSVSLTDDAKQLVAAGRVTEGLIILRRAAAVGDLDALYTLGLWHLVGNVVRRDLCASRDFFRRSAAAGHEDAQHAYTAFLANGTGGAFEWRRALEMLTRLHGPDAAKQLQIISNMALTEDGDPKTTPDGEPLSSSPEISVYRKIFTADECAFLTDLAAPRLEPSVVIDPSSGRTILNPVRTSEGMAFPLLLENPAVHALNRRIGAVSGTRVQQGEPLQILRYRSGQEYKPHLDALPVGTNQRVLTMLIYLNEDYEGGETVFTRLGLSFKGRKGDGLLFRNALPDGQPDPRSQHAGAPVVRGSKLIASRWIRDKPLDLMSPRG